MSQRTQSTSRVHAHLLGISLGEAAPCDEPGGWPEFEITVRYFVTSDDAAKIDAMRKRVFQHLTDTLADDLSEYADTSEPRCIADPASICAKDCPEGECLKHG